VDKCPLRRGSPPSSFEPVVLTLLIKVYVTQQYVTTRSLPKNARCPNLIVILVAGMY
jgi:hypothetical protein